MRQVDFDYATNKITCKEYLAETQTKPAKLTRRQRKKFTKQDAEVIGAFGEFLKHAGPPPIPVKDKTNESI